MNGATGFNTNQLYKTHFLMKEKYQNLVLSSYNSQTSLLLHGSLHALLGNIKIKQASSASLHLSAGHSTSSSCRHDMHFPPGIKVLGLIYGVSKSLCRTRYLGCFYQIQIAVRKDEQKSVSSVGCDALSLKRRHQVSLGGNVYCSAWFTN